MTDGRVPVTYGEVESEAVLPSQEEPVTDGRVSMTICYCACDRLKSACDILKSACDRLKSACDRWKSG